jgi:hypothetical protein
LRIGIASMPSALFNRACGIIPSAVLDIVALFLRWHDGRCARKFFRGRFP